MEGSWSFVRCFPLYFGVLLFFCFLAKFTSDQRSRLLSTFSYFCEEATKHVSKIAEPILEDDVDTDWTEGKNTRSSSNLNQLLYAYRSVCTAEQVPEKI